MRIRILFKVCLSIVGLIIIVGLFQVNRIRNDVHKQLLGLNQLQFHLFKEKLKARAFLKIDKRFVFKSKEEFLPEPKPSITGGFYDHPLKVSFFNDDKEIEIFYTLDGSIPTKQSIHYQDPIYIDKTTVLCFRNFKSDYLPSATLTHTYFINEYFKLPILSLVSDPVNLWNKYSGIYANPWKRGKKWERNAHIEYFDVKNDIFLRFSAEIRINGGASRGNGKKSFRIRYPFSSLQVVDDDHILSEGKQEFERTIILRNTTQFRLRDVLFHTIISQVGCFTSRYTPVILFLNGKIWGIYNIRDRIDKQYLRKNFGLGEYKLIRNLEFWNPESKQFRMLLDWFESNDLSQEEKFEDAADLIDIDNMTDYWVFNIYAGNVDWPHANIAAFKRLDPQDSRWRYLSRDVDDSFGYIVGYDHDTLEWATRNELRNDLLNGMYNDHKSFLKSTLIVRKFLANESYRWKFINRFCDLLNCYLLPEKIEANLDKIIEISAHDLAKDFERWRISEDQYLENIQDIRNFIHNRSKYLFSFLQKKFHLDALLTIELFNQPIEGGEIQINTIKPENYPWKAQYFENAPITLTAVPSRSYRFIRWTESSLGKNSKVKFKLNKNLKVAAIYERITQK
ncbi:MAG: CotH kinase family protein [Nitrospinales bacterium]